MTKKMREKTYSYSILILLHNSHVALYFSRQLLEHFRPQYGLLVSVLHRLTQLLLNKTKGFNTSLFVSMNAFAWCAVHSNQLVLFLKCARGLLKATQMTLLVFKRSAWHPKRRELSRPHESIKTKQRPRIKRSVMLNLSRRASPVISERTQNQFVTRTKANLRSNAV